MRGDKRKHRCNAFDRKELIIQWQCNGLAILIIKPNSLYHQQLCLLYYNIGLDSTNNQNLPKWQDLDMKLVQSL